MTDKNIRKAIRNKFSDTRQYAIAEEVGLTTGFSHRRLDMMVLNCYESNGFAIEGFEIKISTSDLRRELADPEKHLAFFDIIDYYTLAVPKGVVEPLMDIIPKKWGILIVNEDGTAKYKRKPLALEDRLSDRPVPRGFLASIVRAIQTREPCEEELRAEYQRGLKDGKEACNRDNAYYAEKAEREKEKLIAYEHLSDRFRLWGAGGDIEEILSKFEAFRKIRPEWIKDRMDRLVEDINELKKVI